MEKIKTDCKRTASLNFFQDAPFVTQLLLKHQSNMILVFKHIVVTVPFIMFITLKGCSNVIAKPMASRYLLSAIKFDNSCCLWRNEARNKQLAYYFNKRTAKHCFTHSLNAEFKTEEKILILIQQNCQNKQYHMKVLLNSFHQNSHTLGFYPNT